MQRLRELLAASRNLGRPAMLAFCALMLAFAFLLSRLSIYITPTIRAGFSFLPIAFTGLVAGPLAAGLVAALNDVLGALLFPVGPYFPGYTLTALLAGLVEGCVLYRRAPTLGRVLLARALVVVLLNMGLNTLWSSLLYGKAFWALFTGRAIKSLVLLPVDVALFTGLAKLLAPMANRMLDRVRR